MDFNKTLPQQYLLQGHIFINSFLNEYQNHLSELKAFFKNNSRGRQNFVTLPLSVSRMKDFVLDYGGVSCVELLSEYEKNCAIGDFTACERLESRILVELHIFKETWLSMLC